MTTPSRKLILESGDILDLQGVLCEDLKKIISFEHLTLYFPLDYTLSRPRMLPRERKILIPLLWEGRQLGVLVLHRADMKKARSLQGLLIQIATFLLEKLAYIRADRTDAETGLAREELLYQRITDEVSKVRSAEMMHQPLSRLPAYRLCFGVLLLQFSNAEELGMRYGYRLLDTVFHRLVDVARSLLTPDLLAVRIQGYAFAVFMPAAGHSKCRRLGETLLKELQTVSCVNPVTQQPVHPVCTAGYALYPNDMRPAEIHLDMQEQIRILLQRIRLAAKVATPWHVLGSGRILREGGRILENLPMGRLRINLGRFMGVFPGQTFAVFGIGTNRIYKGDISILQARRTDAVAEVTYQETAGMIPVVGDCLESVQRGGTADSGREGEGEIRDQKNFYALVQEKGARLARFSLAMLHIGEDLTGDPEEDEQPDEMGRSCADVHEIWKSVFPEQDSIISGRHGRTILVFFHPDVAAEDLVAPYREVCEKLQERDCTASVGLAMYPFLSFGRADVEACALKTLEYAMLLPAPRVGVCNSLAFNISADRLYSLGDFLGALQEYRTALLVDENNAMAWNSMGVCEAAMGRRQEARSCFLEALNRRTDSAQKAEILYNLGTLCQSLGELSESRRYLEQCVGLDGKHLYAWIRLGQLCEAEGRPGEARHMYEKGDVIEESEGYPSSLAKRHLAQIAFQQNRGDEARTILQTALQHNPQDALSMLLLARIYLDGGEDPSIAEMLARKSVLLEPRPEAWQVLARALRLQGREEDASYAETKMAEKKGA